MKKLCAKIIEKKSEKLISCFNLSKIILAKTLF